MTDFEIKQLFAKSDQALADLTNAQAETDRQQKEIGRKLDKVGELVGGIGRNLGHFAESAFVASLEKNKVLGGVEFDFIHPNMKGFDSQGVEREYDIVLQNGAVIGVLEVKFRLHPDDVERFVHTALPKFREIFALAKDKKILAGVASPSMPAESIERAKELGLAVITQEGQELKTLADAVQEY